MTKVILFDIDGTLVLTGGAGQRAMARAFEDLFSVPNAFQHIDDARPDGLVDPVRRRRGARYPVGRRRSDAVS